MTTPRPFMAPTQTTVLIETCERLARTQRNLPVPLTEQERSDLRQTADLLRKLSSLDGKDLVAWLSKR